MVAITLTGQGSVPAGTALGTLASFAPMPMPGGVAAQPMARTSPAVAPLPAWRMPGVFRPVSYSLARSIVPPDAQRGMESGRQGTLRAGKWIRYSSEVYQYIPDGDSGLRGMLEGGRLNLGTELSRLRTGPERVPDQIHIIYEGVDASDLKDAAGFAITNQIGIRIHDTLAGRSYSASAKGEVYDEPLQFSGSIYSKRQYDFSIRGGIAQLQIYRALKGWQPEKLHADIDAMIGIAISQGVRVLRLDMLEEPDAAMFGMFEESGLAVEVRYPDTRQHFHLWRSSNFSPDVYSSTEGKIHTVPASHAMQESHGVAKDPEPFQFDLDGMSVARRDEVMAFVTGRLGRASLDGLGIEEQILLIEHLARGCYWNKEDLQRFIGVEGMRRYDGYGTLLPFGFDSVQQFDTVKRGILTALGRHRQVIIRKVFIQGSSKVGEKTKTGTPFRWELDPLEMGKAGERSDLDVGVEVDVDGFAEILVAGVLSAMRQKGMDADREMAVGATLRWLDYVQHGLNSGTESDDDASRLGTIELLRPALKMIAGEQRLSGAKTSGQDGLEWWEEYRDRQIRQTETSSNLRLSLGDRRIPYFNAGDEAVDAYWQIAAQAVESGYDRKLQVSYMISGRPQFPSAEEMMVLGGEIFVSPGPNRVH